MTEAITAQRTVTGIDKVQPAVSAVQVALAATMEQTYGVRPGAVVSTRWVRRAAAAVVARAFVARGRGARHLPAARKLMTHIAGAEPWARWKLPAKQVIPRLMARGIDDVVVSVASPQSTVIGGTSIEAPFVTYIAR